MPLQITGRHISVTPELRDYIEKKVPRMNRLLDPIDEIQFILSAGKLDHTAEINFRAGTIKTFTKCSNADPKAAIDNAVDTAVLQIRKAMEKRGGNKKHVGTPRRIILGPLEDLGAEEAGAGAD